MSVLNLIKRSLWRNKLENKYDYYYEMKGKRASYKKDKINWDSIIYITMFYPACIFLFLCIIATYLAKIGVIK